jgi:hypothetical protein
MVATTADVARGAAVCHEAWPERTGGGGDGDMARAKTGLPWEDQVDGAMYATMIEAAKLAQHLPTPYERGTTLIALLGLAYFYADPVKVDRVVEELRDMGLLQDVVGVGILEGIRLALREVIMARFGTIPPALEERIATADEPTLGTLLRQADVAERLEDL